MLMLVVWSSFYAISELLYSHTPCWCRCRLNYGEEQHPDLLTLSTMYMKAHSSLWPDRPQPHFLVRSRPNSVCHTRENFVDFQSPAFWPTVNYMSPISSMRTSNIPPSPFISWYSSSLSSVPSSQQLFLWADVPFSPFLRLPLLLCFACQCSWN
jgi:hypothetical protein